MNTQAPVPSSTTVPTESTVVTVEDSGVRIQVGDELDVVVRSDPQPLGDETAIPVEVVNQPDFWEWGASDFVGVLSAGATIAIAIWAIVQTRRANASEQRERARLQRQELVVIVQEFTRGEGRRGELWDSVLRRYTYRASSISPGAARVWDWISWQFRTLQESIEKENLRYEDAEERVAHTGNAWVGDYPGLEDAVWDRVWNWVGTGHFDDAPISWVADAANKQGVHLEFLPTPIGSDTKERVWMVRVWQNRLRFKGKKKAARDAESSGISGDGV